ncbi:hypothetical protein SAMN04488059_11119 [Devosia psychrophila]|uniref:MBG domain-containing protein n=1 Tax=Devosia psychrophila TaxID=728005 RepID=A0A1I1LZE5_9HYPH|nr:hypothetical protein SAMN04488059_11119 [Devosia psychrophila]
MGGTGLTTAEARQASSYAGWDFTNVWFQSGDMRLILRSEAATPVNGVTTITNLHQLALVGANLSGSYVLGANIDASASAGADAAGIRSAKGFVPIGPAYATGAISGGNIVGGLIGQNYGAANQAYASGSVSGGGAVGGVIGQNYEAVDQAYATGAVSASGSQGGLIGDNYVTVTSSYLDTQTSGLVNGVGSGSSSGATGLTTARMRNPFTFIDTGWNFANIWATPKAGGAPLLRSLVIDPSYDYYIRLSGNMSATYGDTIGTSGIARAGVGVGNVSVGWGSAISATTNVGNYAYGDSNVLALTYSAGVAGDYYLDFGADALSVAQRAITVTADAQSKTYGNANAALTNTVGGSGLVNNDTLSGSLSTMGASSPMSASMG